MSCQSLEAKTIRDLKRQLLAARYAFYKVTQYRYRVAEAVGYEVHLTTGGTKQWPLEDGEAEASFNKAMENYDGIIKNAEDGAVAEEAMKREMEKGFDGE